MCCSNDPSFWRQILILISSSCYSLGIGISLAHPSALNAAILSPNATDIKATIDQASWIASIQGFSGLLGFFIYSPLIQVIGRKPVNILFQIGISIGWILLYISKTVTMLLIAKFIQGLSIGGFFVLALTVSELTHRSKRGVFLTIKKIALSCGSLLCHFLTFSCDWRQIVLVAIIPHILATLIILFCKESPSFYAMKGQYSNCMKSFQWYFGDSDDSKREMKSIISAQMERRNKDKPLKDKNFRWFKKMLRRDFLIPFVIASLATIAVDFSGRYFLLGYIPNIMIELTGDKNIALYYSIIFDCLIILALCISTVVIKSFKRRTILFKFGAASIALMFTVSLSEALKETLLIKWFTPSLLLLHSFVSTFGLIPVSFTISMEIFPLDHRAIGSFTTGIAFTLFYAITMKIVPLMMDRIGIGGTYFIFSLCVTICLTILYYILPETKDKSLQEIEDEIRGVKRSEAEIELILSNATMKDF
ncbi:facilitated trehalose transporter Tret1-like [Papilio machaon]|uniref:facilitated trehalose transporter Tret1-like n=1 Tax=Papilio machaon TaxID=76193 RepID=UPI001E664D04|nr:facilitated trehalose transporter Tret1-like [Papilio machaon]